MAAYIGVIGMGAMGLNVAFLIADRGYKVIGYNRPEEPEKVKAANKLAKAQNVKNFIGCEDNLERFIKALEKPHRILLEISHGENLDKMIEQLKPFLAAKDILVDCGNEWYEETERRIKYLSPQGILFLGMGVSGGYQSARRGPSMSPSGPREAYDALKEVLEKIAARSEDGQPCVSYIGEGGCGHYIKMVHNGIEQGMMSAISEAYGLMRAAGFTHEEMNVYISRWMTTPELSNNYLLGITAQIVTYKDEEHAKGKNCSPYLLENIRDNVVQDANSSEGSGVWTIRDAAARHMPCSTIVAAHFYRLTSAQCNDRQEASSLYNLLRPPKDKDRLRQYHGVTEASLVARRNLAEIIGLAVYTIFLTAFVEGFNLIVKASQDQKWNINIDEALRIYKGGCIIQSDYIIQLLREVYNTHKENNGDKLLHNLFLDQRIADELAKGINQLREIVLLATQSGEPIPASSAAVATIDASYSNALSTSMMQAQLDYFGLHRYSRVDEPLAREKELEKAPHHTEWKHPLQQP